MAVKRPHLIPIWDSFVEQATGLETLDYWRRFQRVLTVDDKADLELVERVTISSAKRARHGVESPHTRCSALDVSRGRDSSQPRRCWTRRNVFDGRSTAAMTQSPICRHSSDDRFDPWRHGRGLIRVRHWERVAVVVRSKTRHRYRRLRLELPPSRSAEPLGGSAGNRSLTAGQARPRRESTPAISGVVRMLPAKTRREADPDRAASARHRQLESGRPPPVPPTGRLALSSSRCT